MKSRWRWSCAAKSTPAAATVVRSPGNEQIPQGYADAVAEYFRKLSKGKQ